MAYLHTLRLNFPHDAYNEYRLNEDRQLEFCQQNGKWRTLENDEVQMHLNLGTEVAHWLQSHWLERDRHRAA
jgi:hypothetical protein